MPVRTQEMGPGVLSIGSGTGATGALLDFSAQVTKASVKWKANAGDSVTTLSGDTVSGDREYSAQLAFTAYQDDLTTGGLVDYTWANAGVEVPFTFEPATTAGRAISGTLIVDPLDVGGDVSKKNTTDATWDCVGKPVLGDSLT